MAFDMNQAWNGAMRLVKANFQLLAIIGGIFVLLPTLALYIFFPELPTMEDIQADTPEQMQENMAAALPQLLPVAVISLVLQLFTYLAMIGLMGRKGPTVGEALGGALRALPSAIGLLLVTVFAAFLFAFVAGLIATLLALGLGVGGATVLLSIIVIAVGIYLSIRLVVCLPVLAIEEQRNPITAILRSWRLTARDSWRILGFYALLAVAYLVLSILIGAIVLGIEGVAGAGGSGNFLIGMINGVLNLIVAMIASAVMVSVYRQLLPAGASAMTTPAGGPDA